MGKSSAPTVGYWYGLTLHMGLCNGPVDAILEIRGSEKPMYPGYTTPATYDTGTESNTGLMITPPSGALQSPITASGAVTIDALNLYGGEKQEGGVQGTLTVLMGEPTQMPSPALAAIETGSRPAYRNICTCVFTGLIAAMSPYIKPWTFRVSRYLQGWNTAVWHPELVKIDRGMNPAHIIYQCLTDPVWSASEDPASGIDDASFLAAATTLYNEGLGLCLKWSSQDRVGDFISVVLNHIAALRYIDPVTNKMGLRLLRDDYDVATLAADPACVLDESDIVEMTSYQPPALDASVNEVVVTYHDVATHKDASITYQNLANVQAQGKVVSQSMKYPGAWNADLGARLAARDCHTMSALLIKGETKVKSKRWADLYVGKVMLLSYSREKCVQMPIRILKVNYGDSTAKTITINWAQDEFGVPASAYVQGAASQWQAPTRDPQPITTQVLMEVPYRDLARMLDEPVLAGLADDAGFLAALGARPAAGVSYNYHLATRLGSAAFVDRATGDFVNGGAISADIAELDTAITLTGFGDLTAIKGKSAALLDGEIVRIDAIDASTGSVTLGRGCVDTPPDKHPAGVRLWCYEDYTAADRTDYIAGESVDAKLLTVAPNGMLALSLATTISLTMAQRQARPYPPGNLKINGTRYPSSVSGALVLTWSHRDRLLSADQLIDTLQTDIGPEAGTTYTVRVYLNSALDSTTTGVAANTLTPTVSGGGVVRVEIDAVRGGLSSWKPLAATFTYVPSVLAITGTAPAGVTGVAYSYTYGVTGGAGPYAWSIASGALPAGVTLNTSTGKISGTPSTLGTYSWVIEVTDSLSNIASKSDGCTIGYATLTLSGTYAAATVGTAYSSDLTIAGGNGSYSNPRAISGSVPAGLALSIVSGNLRLSGTPTGSGGTVAFTAAVDSGDGQTATSAQNIVVTAAVTYASLNPSDKATNITLSNSNLTATGTSTSNGLVRANKAISGKIYFEGRFDVNGGTSGPGIGAIGIAKSTAVLTASLGYSTADGFALWGDSPGARSNSVTAITTTFVAGDRCGIAVDSATGSIWISKNGTWLSGDPAAGTSPVWTGVTGTLYPAVCPWAYASTRLSIQFNPAGFAYAIPTGFSPLTM